MSLLKSKHLLTALTVASVSLGLLSSCGRTERAANDPPGQDQIVRVSVIKIGRHPLQRQLTVSSELVPFQEIDVYAKESGYVNRLLVDYGSRVKKGQLMAVLEIPELEASIRQDEAALKSVQDQVKNADNQLSRIEAQHKVLHMEFQRFNAVSQSKPGLVAQQEVDDVQGRDLAAEAQTDAAHSNAEAARSNVAASQAKLARDEAIFSYARITAPFDGVVTQRYANFGTLMQAGTSSNTSVLPLVRLSQESLYRLVIPVPESYVEFIKVGDEVEVRVPALNKSFPGKVARFSSEVHDTTRTMHTEVDVPNRSGELIPGLYAEATLTLNRNADALTIPVQAVDQQTDHASAFVIDSARKVQVRPIVLGVQGESENETEVLSGLGEGDEVVISDRTSLHPGELVLPQTGTAASYRPRS